jgi:hypothetical protein
MSQKQALALPSTGCVSRQMVVLWWKSQPGR